MTTLEKWENVRHKVVSPATYQEFMEAWLLMIYEGKKSGVMKFNDTTFEVHVDILETKE